MNNRITILEEENDMLIEKIVLRSDFDKIKECVESTDSENKLREEIRKIFETETIELTRLDKMIRNRGSTGNIDTPSDITRRIKIEIPKFKGQSGERLIKFLMELENYVAIIKPENHELRCIISQALEEDARNGGISSKVK